MKKTILIISVLLTAPILAQQAPQSPLSSTTKTPATAILYDSEDPELEEKLKSIKQQAIQGNMTAAQQVYTRYALAEKYDQARAWAARYMDLLTKDAENGNAKSMMVLATNYLYGKDYTQQDQEQAVTWFCRAAETGEPAAAYLLGDLFSKQGNIAASEEFYTKAYQEYTKLADINSNALYWQGYMEQQGLGTPANPDTGIEKLQKAAEQGNQWAIAHLFKTYAQGIGTQADLKRAIGYARQLADTGQDGLMAWAVACAYLNGQGVEKDERIGEHYLDIAAAANIPSAICMKGDRLQKIGKTEEAYNYLNQAASMGEIYAMVAAGRMLLYGEGTEKDEERGLRMLQSACDQYASPDAAYELCRYYDNIDEPELADSWYMVASERGIAEAMARRGLLHINPLSAAAWSPTSMYHWWKMGSEAGDPTCTLYLRLFLYVFIPLVLIFAFGVPALIINNLNKRAESKKLSKNNQR